LFLAVWIVCLVPSTVIELWLGYQFGLWHGFLLVYSGKVIGCLVSFGLGRTVLKRTCTRCLSSHELFRAFDLAVSREPYTVCFLARASYIPIALKNYGFAVLSVPTRAFVLALVMVENLNSALLVFIGSTAGSFAQDSEMDGVGSHSFSRTPMVIGSIMLLTLAVYISKRTRLALAELREKVSREPSSDLLEKKTDLVWRTKGQECL